jgi:hypothetical protein
VFEDRILRRARENDEKLTARSFIICRPTLSYVSMSNVVEQGEWYRRNV